MSKPTRRYETRCENGFHVDSARGCCWSVRAKATLVGFSLAAKMGRWLRLDKLTAISPWVTNTQRFPHRRTQLAATRKVQQPMEATDMRRENERAFIVEHEKCCLANDQSVEQLG